MYDAAMDSVEEYLSAPRLEGDAARAFQRSRERVATRHHNWRHNFPAVGLLLDTDEERAHALAGNYATEARETVGAWLSSQESVVIAGTGPDAELVAWLEGFWNAWRREVFDSEAFLGMDHASRERFRSVFDDLTERFRRESVAHLQRPAEVADGARGWAALAAPLVAVGRWLRGVFLPGDDLD